MSQQYELKCSECGKVIGQISSEPSTGSLCNDCENNQGGVLLILKTIKNGVVSTESNPKKIRLNKKTEELIRQDCPLPEINSFFAGYRLDSIEPLRRVKVVLERTGQAVEFGKTLEEQGLRESDSLVFNIIENA
jgi:hypothetical protein